MFNIFKKKPIFTRDELLLLNQLVKEAYDSVSKEYSIYKFAHICKSKKDELDEILQRQEAVIFLAEIDLKIKTLLKGSE